MLSPKRSWWPPIFFTFLTSLTHHLSMVKFSLKKSMLENFRVNVLNISTERQRITSVVMGSCYNDIHEWVEYSTTNTFPLRADESLLPLFSPSLSTSLIITTRTRTSTESKIRSVFFPNAITLKFNISRLVLMASERQTFDKNWRTKLLVFMSDIRWFVLPQMFSIIFHSFNR